MMQNVKIGFIKPILRNMVTDEIRMLHCSSSLGEKVRSWHPLCLASQLFPTKRSIKSQSDGTHHDERMCIYGK